MKFITETDLRDLYKIQPFTDYDLQEGERLTPGARQFLLDRGVDLYDRNDPYADIGTGTSVVGSMQTLAGTSGETGKQGYDNELHERYRGQGTVPASRKNGKREVSGSGSG